MKPALLQCCLIGLFLAFSPVQNPVVADTLVYTNQTPIDGTKGLVIDRTAGEPFASGIIWTQSGLPAWVTGIDVTQDYGGTPDLVLAANPTTQSDNLRIRSDDARLILGYRIGHPILPFQFTVQGGMPGRSLGGVAVGAPNWMPQLYLFNENAPLMHRDTIDFDGLFCLQTDSGANNTNDFYLYNRQTTSLVYHVDADSSFRLDAPALGFYGAPPTTKPVITGSWADGSAARSLLAALVKLGLVTDQTSP